jgi:hypothetical protein
MGKNYLRRFVRLQSNPANQLRPLTPQEHRWIETLWLLGPPLEERATELLFASRNAW